MVNIFGDLKHATVRQTVIVISPDNIRETSGKGFRITYWLNKCPDAMKYIYGGLPYLRRNPLITTLYFDSNYFHDQVTRRSI